MRPRPVGRLEKSFTQRQGQGPDGQSQGNRQRGRPGRQTCGSSALGYGHMPSRCSCGSVGAAVIGSAHLEHRPDHGRADSVGARAGSQRAVPAWPSNGRPPGWGRPFKAPSAQKGQLPGLSWSIRRVAPAGTSETTTVTRSTVPSLRTTCTSPPESTKPDPAGTTCGEQVGSSAR